MPQLNREKKSARKGAFHLDQNQSLDGYSKLRSGSWGECRCPGAEYRAMSCQLEEADSKASKILRVRDLPAVVGMLQSTHRVLRRRGVSFKCLQTLRVPMPDDSSITFLPFCRTNIGKFIWLVLIHQERIFTSPVFTSLHDSILRESNTAQ